MRHFDVFDAVRSGEHCDAVWIHIPAFEDDGVERAQLILLLLIRIHECWWEFVEG